MLLLFTHAQKDQPDTYRVCVPSPDMMLPELHHTVTFTTPDPARLPLPSRDYLAIHACCAQVAHLSGAIGYFEMVQCELEDACFLAADGSPAKALDFLLSQIH